MELFPDHEYAPRPERPAPEKPAADLPPSDSRTIPPWELLLGEAKRFQSGQVWKEWLGDCPLGVLFGSDPAEMRLISILGENNTMFSFHYHTARSGSRFFHSLYGPDGPQDVNPMVFLDMLECDLVPLSEAEERDLAILEEHGGVAQFESRVPVFRTYQPGYYPWFPEKHEALELGKMLHLFHHFQDEIIACLDDLADVRPPSSVKTMQIPVLSLRDGGAPDDSADWSIAIGELPEYTTPEPEAPAGKFYPSEIDKLRVKKRTWEVGINYQNNPVGNDDGRPCLPLLGLAVPLDTDGLPIPVPPEIHLAPEVELHEVIRIAFCQLAENQNHLPSKVRVSEKAHGLALRDILSEKGIDLVVGPCDELEEIFRGMAEFSSGGDAQAEHLEMLRELVEEHNIDITDPSQVMALAEKMVGDFPDFQNMGKIQNMDNIIPFENDSEEVFHWEDPKAPKNLPGIVGEEHYHFHLALRGLEKQVWREVTVPVDTSFYEFHHVIQDLIGWENDHGFMFSIGPVRKPDRILGEPDETCVPLIEAIGRKRKKLHYVYDFGDNWEVDITVKKILKPDTATPLPKCLAGKGVGPPEDCGGIYDFLDLKTGKHHWNTEDEGSEEYWKEYFSNQFDPESFNQLRAGK